MNPKSIISKFKPNIKMYLWPAIAVFVCLMLILFVILPQVIGYFNTGAVINQTQKRVALLNQKTVSLQKIDSSAYRDNLAITFIALPREKDIPSAISQIQSLAGSAKLQINGITFVNSDGGQDLKQQNYSVKIDLVGDTSSLKDFIIRLKDAPMIMRLTGLDVTGNKNGTLQATLTLTAYYQNDSVTLGDIEKPVEGLNAQELALLDKLQQNSQTLPIVSSNNNLGVRGKSDPFR